MLSRRTQSLGKSTNSIANIISFHFYFIKFFFAFSSSQIISYFLAIFLATINMIRRLLSTFIDFPTTANHHDFFKPTDMKTQKRFNYWPLENFSFLFDMSPCFPVNSKNIRIISEPSDFYDSILRNASAAKYRISFASLYLGIGKMESDLVKAIQANITENNDLKVNILLDFTRGTRGKKNSKTMIMPLVEQSRNCNLSLYHTPMLRGITKKLAPARWNELLGLQHMKIYIFDDVLILSGANLSNDYFTNRQDRYIEIKDVNVSNFFNDVIGKVQEFSMQVDANGDTRMHDSWNLLPYESSYKDFVVEAQRRFKEYFKSVYDRQYNNHDFDETADTWIFPTIEMGQIGIHHDSLVSNKLLCSGERGSTLKMTSGYFNLTQTYMDSLVKKCEADCSIIMAHPNANGFKGSKFPSGGIPDAYSLIARKFYEQIKENGQENRFSLLEYERDNWTYHAKGLWYYHNGSKLPCMTVIGSSNYGERSVHRDLEAQVCLVTVNKELQKSLKIEYDHLLRYSETAEKQLLQRLIPNWVKGVVFFFKKFF